MWGESRVKCLMILNLLKFGRQAIKMTSKWNDIAKPYSLPLSAPNTAKASLSFASSSVYSVWCVGQSGWGKAALKKLQAYACLDNLQKSLIQNPFSFLLFECAAFYVQSDCSSSRWTFPQHSMQEWVVWEVFSLQFYSIFYIFDSHFVRLWYFCCL